MAEWSFGLYGLPIQQGELKCVGGNRGGRVIHNLVHSNARELKAWRREVAKAARATIVPTIPRGGLTGPVGVFYTFTLPRPATVPLRIRAYPQVRPDGDHLDRAINDALTGPKGERTGVWGDDSQVCEWGGRKLYPDSPGAASKGGLDRPGVVIRIYTLT